MFLCSSDPEAIVRRGAVLRADSGTGDEHTQSSRPLRKELSKPELVRAAHEWEKRSAPRREEWLIVEWPQDKDQPTDYWLSNLPLHTKPERLARLARLRRKIELDYKQLKGELGLDHYEGRSSLGWYHHTALVTAAHGFLRLERQHPNHQRPA